MYLKLQLFYIFYVLYNIINQLIVKTLNPEIFCLPEKLPSWLSGLIQQPKDEPTLPDPLSSDPSNNTKDTTEIRRVQKSKVVNETKTDDENPPPSSSSILSLLKGKDGLQSSILELIQKLAKKKQDIQHATITLIRDQQNNDLLIKVLNS